MNLAKNIFCLSLAFIPYLSGSLAFIPYLSGVAEASDTSVSPVLDNTQSDLPAALASPPISSVPDKAQLDMASNGYAVAVWQNNIGHNSVIQANVFVDSWTGPKTLSISHHAIDPRLAVAAHRNDIIAVAVWIQKEKGIRSLHAAMLLSSTKGWTNAAQISIEHEDVISPYYDVRLNDAGNVIVVWSSVDRSGNHYIRASTSHIDYKNVWSLPTHISGP